MGGYGPVRGCGNARGGEGGGGCLSGKWREEEEGKDEEHLYVCGGTGDQ